MCSPFSPGADSHPLPGSKARLSSHPVGRFVTHPECAGPLLSALQDHCYQYCYLVVPLSEGLYIVSNATTEYHRCHCCGLALQESFGVFRVLTDIGTLEAQLLWLKLPWECGWNLFGTKPHPPYAIVVSWGNSNLSILSGNSILPLGIRCCRGECLQYVSGSSAAH